MTTDVWAGLEDWRARAAGKLDWQAARAAKYQRYYDGEMPVNVIMDTEERQTFARFLRMSGANWAELVVNTVAERLTVVGFRFGASDDQAWAIWQANAMDSDGELVQTDALVAGSSFVLVQPDESNPTGVSITAESPRQATVLYAPGSRVFRDAGYKRWEDPETQARYE